jgi:GNAT superfamily N-acetyltransferase
MANTAIHIRNGEPRDVPALLALIKELAHYERALDEVVITESQLLRDGFGDQPLFALIVAEVDGAVEGIALYYFAYSTWKGKYLYLEDLVVRETFRGKGIGKQLFEAVVNVARKEKVKRMGWQVLDWNKPAIKFYESYGADLASEWLNGRLYFEEEKHD